MTLTIRNYQATDYASVINLYKQGDLFGGQYDENRDSEDRMNAMIENHAENILVAEDDNKTILGTISLVDDGRVAWLFRFAVQKAALEKQIAQMLYNRAKESLKQRGHNQILIYCPNDNKALKQRYSDLGMNEGNDYTCFWADI